MRTLTRLAAQLRLRIAKQTRRCDSRCATSASAPSTASPAQAADGRRRQRRSSHQARADRPTGPCLWTGPLMRGTSVTTPLITPPRLTPTLSPLRSSASTSSMCGLPGRRQSTADVAPEQASTLICECRRRRGVPSHLRASPSAAMGRCRSNSLRSPRGQSGLADPTSLSAALSPAPSVVTTVTSASPIMSAAALELSLPGGTGTRTRGRSRSLPAPRSRACVGGS
jgi:hypothetical protein